MLVSHILEDLHAVFDQAPQSVGYPIGVASYKNGLGSDILVKRIGSFHWDEDEFFLVPEGLGHIYGLNDTELTAAQLASALEKQHEILGYNAYVRDQASVHQDGTIITLNMPLWGAGIQQVSRLVYFYYGDRETQS